LLRQSRHGTGDPLGAIALARFGTGSNGRDDRGIGLLRRTRREGRRRIVFDAELDRLRCVFPGDLGSDRQRHVDPGGDAAAGEEFAVDDDALGDRLGAERAQQIA